MEIARMSEWRVLGRGVAVAILGWVVLFGAVGLALAEPTAAATATFNMYIGGVEGRLARQHGSLGGFLGASGTADIDARLRRGELIVEKLTPAKGPDLPGAMLHHWRATAFVRGATVTELEQLLKGFSGYPLIYSPEVVRARMLAGQGDRLQVEMRVRQKHVITVVMDTAYEVEFGRLDAGHGYSASRSTRISEIDSPGTRNERVMNVREEHGFLWRQNTYWSYEERDGGLYMQIESVSLTRAIPAGLGWAIRPFVESVPRESLEFTLRSTCDALKQAQDGTVQLVRAGH